MEHLRDLWPVAGLVVRTPRLELRWPDDDDLVALAALAGTGIHDPDEMPFGRPWTRTPAGSLEPQVLQFHWRQRGEWSPESWVWNPVAVVDGQVVGTQACHSESFAVRRTVGTGSWLGRAYQGQGLGREMRRAVLHLAFAGLGAWRAETTAFEDNVASLAVTRSLGYRPNGDGVHEVEGRRRRSLRFVLDARDWDAATMSPDVQIEGLEACRHHFGTPAVPSAGDLSLR